MSGPRRYSEQVLGAGATQAQLDELHRLHAAAHPVVTHGRGLVEVAGEKREVRDWTDVTILSSNPKTTMSGPGPHTIASGRAVCNTDSGDQYSKRRGVSIAFGRALTELRMEVEGVRHAAAA